MLKEIIGRIVEAEAKAENIERDAFEKAEAIKAAAALNAEQLRSNPCEEIKEQAASILKDAEDKAKKLAASKIESNSVKEIKNERIDTAADAIVTQFLKWGL